MAKKISIFHSIFEYGHGTDIDAISNFIIIITRHFLLDIIFNNRRCINGFMCHLWRGKHKFKVYNQKVNQTRFQYIILQAPIFMRDKCEIVSVYRICVGYGPGAPTLAFNSTVCQIFYCNHLNSIKKDGVTHASLKSKLRIRIISISQPAFHLPTVTVHHDFCPGFHFTNCFPS